MPAPKTMTEATIRADLISFLKNLREEIIMGFEKFESQARFERKEHQYPSGGYGEIGLLKGDVFEKAAVNFSLIKGKKIPFQEELGPFVATGISLITHMKNPHAPTVHMNLRYIETETKRWFGGGYDLTPMGFPHNEDTIHFHNVAKKTLAPFGAEIYPDFMQQAKEYFYIKHRNKERGVGGIFFDHYNTGNFEKDLAMWKAIGTTFLNAIIPIYEKRIAMPYTQVDKEKQQIYRGHYAEFNLAYDRGTKFGFESRGNTEAILCSMPPDAKW